MGWPAWSAICRPTFGTPGAVRRQRELLGQCVADGDHQIDSVLRRRHAFHLPVSLDGYWPEFGHLPEHGDQPATLGSDCLMHRSHSAPGCWYCP
jgi:hypothetical protein